ncbi:acyl-CoA-binding domain-containing protein 6 [Dioscorea cayenensis subsp. rotundata]|uniref:Acyl-CoA-binding domain-containing protein 6 n=1 Tax=Dioscorea cayennensis subsp. rotundata TaxID=55577 RepID=A0AB40BI25_DIOCR|nr:acyl-CoA-binding domain-containing protein 6 [Dioscorea cayenensis subsp. rotundata]
MKSHRSFRSLEDEEDYGIMGVWSELVRVTVFGFLSFSLSPSPLLQRSWLRRISRYRCSVHRLPLHRLFTGVVFSPVIFHCLGPVFASSSTGAAAPPSPPPERCSSGIRRREGGARQGPGRRLSQSNSENAVSLSASGLSDDLSCQCAPAAALDLDKFGPGSLENWAVLSIDGERPTPRSHHAATVVGSKMVVVGGESGKGLLDDTLILNMEKLAWVVASPKAYLSPNGVPSNIPACKGHCLVSWGKMVLLIGGKTDPVSDRVQVWSFDVESECWSSIEAKGDIPAARSGHTVIRAGPVLILFGGEDSKGRKLNDLHMFDLKSLTWLPLHYTGTGPSPRSNHAAALYDDRILLVFGGQAKSKILNDLYSLDFETMVWSRIKVKGHHPSPRAGCCGALCGTKWYIAGGGSKKKRTHELLNRVCTAIFIICIFNFLN